jgi:hypothetical protein
MTDELQEGSVKRGPGRPKKTPDPVVRDPKRPMFKHAADTLTFDPTAVDPVDPLHIDPAEIPEGVAFLWERISANGQPDDRNVQAKRAAGWQPVCKGDCDGRFDRRWDRKQDGEQLTYDGTIGLVYRPMELHQQAKRREYIKAREQMLIKERALTGGDMPNVSLDAQHPSAIGSNKITKSYERIEVPEK